MSFYLRLSVATPHSVATARRVSLFASALPESSLCLLVCLRVLLAGVLLGFSGYGCSSGWIVAVSFPGLGFCQWAERPYACCPGLLAGCSCFLPGGRFPFCWLCLGLRVSSPSFYSPQPRSLSLSLSPSCSSLSPLGFSWLGLVSVLATFIAWIVPRHLMVAYLLVSLRFFPVIFRSLFPTFLVGSSSFASLDALPVCSSRLSGALVALPGSLLCLLPGFRSLSSQFPVVGLVLCFLPCGPAPSLSLFGLLAVPPFLLSRFVAVCFLVSGFLYSLAVYLVLGSSFPVLVIYSFLLRGTRGGIWILPSAPLGCFILSLSRLVSCFCFLGRLLRQFSWF